MSISQKDVKIRISYQTSSTNQNTVHIDSVLVEQGFGTGASLKIHLLLFDSDCNLLDTLDFGEYNPYGYSYKAYHFRQNQTADMMQLDSTLKYRIPDGMQYFLYTPCQYRKDFVNAAYPPMLQTLDSLWGPKVGHSGTAFIAYGVKGDLSAREAKLAYVSQAVYSMSKTICQYASTYVLIDDNEQVILYPNPSSEFVNLEFKDSKIREVIVHDCFGKQVFELTTDKNSYQLGLSSLTAGYYTIRIQDDTAVYSKQLVLR